jgi:hypothetical protein
MKAIACTLPCGLFNGFALAYSIYESRQRGDDYYRLSVFDCFSLKFVKFRQLMDGPWFNDNARRYFMYACDIVSCFLFVGGWEFVRLYEFGV